MLKDLQYSLSRLTTDVRTQMARSNPLQRQDTKALSMWIYKERTDLSAMRSLAYQHSETNRMLMEWATEERQEAGPDSQDLEDIVSKLCKLLEKQVELENQYAGKYRQYRHAIKAIREREEQLSEMREKKKTLQARITHLAKTNPKSPKKIEFQKELDALQKDTLETEMEMGDFKRFALREAFYLRFNAMNEFAEKSAILAGFGNYLVDLLDIEPTPAGQANRRPYENEEVAETIVHDALLALEAWSPAEGEQRATFAIPGMDTDTMSMDDASSVYTMDQESGQLKSKNQYFYQPEYNTSTSSFGPSLPPRRPFQPSHLYSLANPSQDRIPYPPYDNPPPAYADDGSLSSNAPVSLVDRERPYEDKHLVESEGFESPFQSHNTLPSHLQAGPSTGSPLPMHSPLPGSIAQPSMPLSYQTNYQQLFRHVSMRQQGASQRPYNEFQQQFAGPGGPGLGYRQRIDAGGFRIPPPLEPVLSAEEEKQQLSERYAAEEEAYQRKQMEDMELIDKQPPKVPDHHQDSSPESDDIEPKRPDSDAIEPKSPKSDDDIEPKSPVSSDQTTDGLTESPKEPENETIIHKPHQDD